MRAILKHAIITGLRIVVLSHLRDMQLQAICVV